MYNLLENDLQDIETIFEKVKNKALNFLTNINNIPTSSSHKLKKFNVLKNEGLGTAGALEQFNKQLEGYIVASTGPRYWGYVTGGSTPAAIAGDWLASIYDQNPQAVEGAGDISAIIEKATIKLLLDFFELPNNFSGGFVTGATMSNFTALAVARQWLGKRLGKDFAKEGVLQKLNILSATPHASSIKALSMLGIGSNNLIKVAVKRGNREAMDTEDLERKVAQLNGEPFILISSGGTVNTVDFDDFETIGRLRARYNFWWHIDAAFGAFAVLSPAYKHLMKGWESSDSITIDCHKWLNVPYENAVYFIKEKHSLCQVETFQNSNAPYLGDPLEQFSYLNFLPENSRRLRALPVWFTLVAYGKKGYQNIVENNIVLAKLFGKFITENPDFELLAPVRLNTICFTLSSKHPEDKVQSFLKKLNDSGTVFMTPTIYNHRKGIRAAFVNWRTTEEDINIVSEAMKKLL